MGVSVLKKEEGREEEMCVCVYFLVLDFDLSMFMCFFVLLPGGRITYTSQAQAHKEKKMRGGGREKTKTNNDKIGPMPNEIN